MTTPQAPLRTRLLAFHVEGFRSIKNLTVHFTPTTFLFGPNGAGKSNILDALLFFVDALNIGLSRAFNLRGGAQNVFYKDDKKKENNLTIFEFLFDLNDSHLVNVCISYKMKIKLESQKISIMESISSSLDPNDDYEATSFSEFFDFFGMIEWICEKITENQKQQAIYSNFLFSFWKTAKRHIFSHLEILRKSQLKEHINQMQEDGANLNQIWSLMLEQTPDTAARVLHFLQLILPGLQKIEVEKTRHRTDLNFVLTSSNGEQNLSAEQISDGFLRAFAILVAVYQPHRPDLIALDEFEMSLHPQATQILLDALISAPNRPQFIITTHSPTVLECSEVDVSMVRVVKWKDGETIAGPVSKAQQQLIQDRVVTLAELLTDGSLDLDQDAVNTTSLRPDEP